MPRPAPGPELGSPADPDGPLQDAAPAADVHATDGRALLQALFAACRLSAMWGFGNKLTVEALATLGTAVRDAAGERPAIVLRFANDMAFIDDRHLRVDFSGYGALRYVLDRVARQGIGEIRLPADPSPDELRPLLSVLETRHELEPGPDAAFEAARDALRRAPAARVTIGPPFDGGADGHDRDGSALRTDGVRAWLRLARAARTAHASIAAAEAGGGAAFAPGPCRAAVQRAVELLEAGDPVLAAATDARHVPDFAAAHAANVCIRACAVGLAVGLDRPAACELGLLALLHDAAPTGGAEDGDPGRRLAVALLSGLGLAEGSMRCVQAARRIQSPPAAAPLFARIVRACCFLDAQTTPAGPDRPAHPTHDVLAAMAADDGSCFDGAVVRALADVAGGGDSSLDGAAYLRALDDATDEPL